MDRDLSRTRGLNLEFISELMCKELKVIPLLACLTSCLLACFWCSVCPLTMKLHVLISFSLQHIHYFLQKKVFTNEAKA